MTLTGFSWRPARPSAPGVVELGEAAFPVHPARRARVTDVEIAVDNKRMAGISFEASSRRAGWTSWLGGYVLSSPSTWFGERREARPRYRWRIASLRSAEIRNKPSPET